MHHYWWFVPMGFAIGAYGTLIGTGGGFALMPVLIILYPHLRPEVATSMSLAVVFFNALSGSFAYGRMKRIDYRSGLLFAAATVPGAIVGALNTAYIPRRAFDVALGLIMIAATAVLLLFPATGRAERALENRRSCDLLRRIVERDGTTHVFCFNWRLGVALSFVVGYVSSTLGIGGGIVQVPLLIHLLNFPVHIATATSQFMLAVMALTGTIVHVAAGSFTEGVHRTIAMAAGVLIGAQFGALLSRRIRGRWILRGLAVALAVAGVRILINAL